MKKTPYQARTKMTYREKQRYRGQHGSGPPWDPSWEKGDPIPKVRICFDCGDLYPVDYNYYGAPLHDYDICPHCCDDRPNTGWFRGTWVRDLRVREDGMLIVQK